MIIKSHTNSKTFEHDYTQINNRLVRLQKKPVTIGKMPGYAFKNGKWLKSPVLPDGGV